MPEIPATVYRSSGLMRILTQGTDVSVFAARKAMHKDHKSLAYKMITIHELREIDYMDGKQFTVIDVITVLQNKSREKNMLYDGCKLLSEQIVKIKHGNNTFY